MKFMRLFIIILSLALASLACFSAGTQSAPSDVLFSDDFSKTDKKWDQVNNTSASTDYYNNAYRITVNDTNSDAWSNPGKESFTDVHIEVDATKNGARTIMTLVSSAEIPMWISFIMPLLVAMDIMEL